MHIEWREDGRNVTREWHVGQPFPKITGRVITLTVDGDELDFLLHLIRAAEETEALK